MAGVVVEHRRLPLRSNCGYVRITRTSSEVLVIFGVKCRLLEQRSEKREPRSAAAGSSGYT